MKTPTNKLATRVANYLRSQNITRLWRQQYPEIGDRAEFMAQLCLDLSLPYKTEKALFDALSRDYKGALVLSKLLGSRCFWLPEAWAKNQHWLKIEKEGARAWRANKRNRDNPYPQSTDDHQAWSNGFGNASDQSFLRLVKKNPRILQGS